jgi:UDP-N-acetylmuramate dehydrogenase
MMALQTKFGLAGQLPPLFGRVLTDAPLGPATWFRVGGAAEVLVRPSSTSDLATLLTGLPHGVPLTVIGAASNLIIRDGGIHGVVVRLARGFSTVTVQPDGVVAPPPWMQRSPSTPPPPGWPGWSFCRGFPVPSAAPWR